MDKDVIISFENFGFQYTAQAEPTLYNINLNIRKGEKVLIAGPSGCGKTTLFKILTGEMDYDEGEVYINPDKRLGLISQIPRFPYGYTVEDVLRSAFAAVMAAKRKMEAMEAEMA